MSIESDRERLLQKHNLDWIRRDPKATEMITVYRWNPENVRGDYFILGGLIPHNLVQKILSGEHISGEAFAKILEEAVEFLDFLIAAVQSGIFSDKSDEVE